MHQRLLAFIGIVLMVGLAGFAVDHRGPSSPRPVASPTASPSPSWTPEPLPTPNIRGSQIRLLRDQGKEHPSPEVLPRSPKNFIVGDCSGLKLFNTDNSVLDRERGVLMIDWWDPGIDDNRLLTILINTPTCRRHDQVRNYLK